MIHRALLVVLGMLPLSSCSRATKASAPAAESPRHQPGGVASPYPLPRQYVGCLHLRIISDTTWAPTPADSGGDRIPSPTTLVLTSRPVPLAQNPRHRPFFLATWDFFGPGDLVAWAHEGDTLRVYAVMYGLESRMALTGAPTALAGSAEMVTHMGYGHRAKVEGGLRACADTAAT